jgi:hypothetical protein
MRTPGWASVTGCAGRPHLSPELITNRVTLVGRHQRQARGQPGESPGDVHGGVHRQRRRLVETRGPASGPASPGQTPQTAATMVASRSKVRKIPRRCVVGGHTGDPVVCPPVPCRSQRGRDGGPHRLSAGRGEITLPGPGRLNRGTTEDPPYSITDKVIPPRAHPGARAPRAATTTHPWRPDAGRMAGRHRPGTICCS